MKNIYRAQFDGSTRLDDSKSTIGFIIYMPNGTILCKSRRVVEYATSTEVEYKALIELLKALHGLGIQDVFIRGDCKGVIEEVRGNQPANGTRQDLCAQVHQLMNRFKSCTIRWVPRKKNGAANYLSRKSLGVKKA